MVWSQGFLRLRRWTHERNGWFKVSFHNNRFAITLGSLILLSFGLLGASLLVPGEKGLKADKDSFDFGTVRPSAQEHTFQLYNQGREAVQVDRIMTLCGCTSVTIPHKRIGAGERTTVRCVVDTHGRAGPFTTSFQVIYVLEGERAPTERALVIALHANVDPIVRVVPGELRFANGKSETRYISVSSEDPKVRLINVSADHSAIHTKIIENGTKIEISFESSKWADFEATASVSIETTCATERKIRIPVRVGAGSPTEVTPPL